MIKEKNKKLIAQVIPASKLPQDMAQFFSYTVPKKFENKIKVGNIVEISLRKKNALGMVYKLQKENIEQLNYKLKEINKTLDNSISISEKQIQLAEYISNYYYAPLSLIIKTIIPTITKKESRKDIDLNQNYRVKKIDDSKKDKAIKFIKDKNEILFIHNLHNQKHSLYLDLIKSILKKNEQALVLMPEYFDIYNFSQFYIDCFTQEKVAIINSELTNNQYFEQWKKIKNGDAKIIIGTRQTVFAPFRNLKLIIIDDEQNSSYKQWDQNPRYHCVTVAKKLSEICKAKIILSSSTPSVESYYKTTIKNHLNIFTKLAPDISSKTKQNEQLTNLTDCTSSELSPMDQNNNSRKIFHKLEIINMGDERKRGNYSVFSEKLKNDLIENVYQKKQVIIFIPRLGENTVTKCNDCNFIAECEECRNSLIKYENHLYCTHCRKNINLIKQCPKCQGQNIKSFGYGSENIENEINKIFENKNIKIQRLDSAKVSDGNNQTKIYKNFINRKIDILIGTQMVLKNWNMKNLSIFSIMFPEIIFSQPDFKSKEKSFQFLNFISQIANDKTQVIIQTNDIDNLSYKLLEERNRLTFYQNEINNRKSSQTIGYPPFSQLIKLIYKDQNLEKCKFESESMYKLLQEKISSDKNLKINFEITKPFPASRFKEYGKYRYNIIIKSICKKLEFRDSLLNHIKKDWIIDIDPDGVL
ncbi:MAG: primosomal protein N' [Patescibacteria group bacterium]|nr:primosomal protein N' [Patescibacteria group bacterium]